LVGIAPCQIVAFRKQKTLDTTLKAQQAAKDYEQQPYNEQDAQAD
jgi:hypothetical protein